MRDAFTDILERELKAREKQLWWMDQGVTFSSDFADGIMIPTTRDEVLIQIERLHANLERHRTRMLTTPAQT
jgi:hypothetical protein